MNQMNTVEGKAKKTKSTFSMECGVAINIKQSPVAIWQILTNGPSFTKWNSTVTSLEGDIALNNTIKLKSSLDAKRIFKLKVTQFKPSEKMVWEDGFAPMFKGVRIFRLTPQPDGSTDFSMIETFKGLMLPVIGPALPDFGPSFEKYAADLKKVAERKS